LGQINMKNGKSKEEALTAIQSKQNKIIPSLSRKVWQMYLQVGFIGLIIAVSLWYVMNTGSRIAKQYYPLVDAAMEIKLKATTAHLWFEEIIGGDSSIDINEVWNNIDKAGWFAQAMLEGGESVEGNFIPLDDPELRQNIMEVKEKIRAFRNIAEERLANIDKSTSGSDIDQRFDSVFESFLEEADEVETALQQIMKRDIKQFLMIQTALIVLCFILTGFIGVILHRFQKKQFTDLSLLKASNQLLQAREQQLLASNQQLEASEQQLKASNQQLQASEQQLRASNQQLRASEQQLKASNQQLRASEQQLKASNQQLIQSQQKLALHLQNTPLGVIQWGPDFNVTEWNKAAEKIFGFTEEEAIGRHAAGLIVPESVKEIVDKVWQDLLDQQGGTRSINENITKDNKSIMCDWYNTPLIDENGKTLGVASLVLDITERKRAEQSAQDLAHIVERSLNEIYIFDAETFRFVQVNRGACENIGYTLEELAKLTPLDIKPEFTKEKFIQLVEPLKNGAKEIIKFETVHKRKDGSLYNVEVHLQLSDFLGKPVFVAIILDITETKRLQALESRAERLEMAGTVAGQVAHDFNNLLAPIVAYPDFIRDELPSDHKAHVYLDSIENAALKIANINQDLLVMGRRGHYNQEVLDLNRVVSQAAQEMKSRTKTVTFEMNLCQDIMKIKGGNAQIHRMLTNLLVNAQDAMGDIGQVTIKTENYYADDTTIAFGRVPKGEYVKLTITDNGCGIPDDIIQNILDPFFSTKMADKKRGSGLGLSVVDAVTRDHNGYLDLSSKVGHGTSFYIYFPVTREDSEADDSTYLAGGTEKVLVIDDDDVQREVTTQLLEKLGYETDSVVSGEKAMEFLRENRQDLVILDMVMPGGIDGTETYRQIVEIYPEQKAIILSGFSESEQVLEVQKLGAGAFIKKPVTRKIIAAAVRTELDRKIPASKS